MASDNDYFKCDVCGKDSGGNAFAEGWFFRYGSQYGGHLCPDCVTTKEPAPAHYQELANLLNRVDKTLVVEGWDNETVYFDDDSGCFLDKDSGGKWVVKEDK